VRFASFDPRPAANVDSTTLPMPALVLSDDDLAAEDTQTVSKRRRMPVFARR